MNACRFSGWIPFEPETRFTPSGRKVICFAVRVRDGHGTESLLRFQMDGDPLRPVPAELAPGRAVEIEAEALVQTVPRPNGHAVSRMVFHVTRLVPRSRRCSAADPGLQLALF